MKLKGQAKAFTLIEVITVLFVISLGVVGVLSMIVDNIRNQGQNRNTIVAYQLAQEGIELVRRVRDTNWLLGYDWRTDLADGLYCFDYDDDVPQISGGTYSCELGIDEKGIYHTRLATESGSGYRRIIAISTVNPKQVKIQSNIYWNQYGRDYVYSLDTYLYDWR